MTTTLLPEIIRSPVRNLPRNIPLFGAGIWTPATLFTSGQQGVWYEPRPTRAGVQLLYQDAAGTTPVTADGDPVGFMRDLSGNGNNATQPTSAARPLYRTDGTFNRSDFDGADDYLGPVTYSSPVTQPCTLSIAMDRKTADSAVVFITGLGSSDRHQMSITGGGNFGCFVTGSGIIGQSLPAGRYVLTGVINGANSELRVNGVVVASGDLGTDSSGGLTVSALWDGNASAHQDVYGVIHVEGIDSVDLIENYLANLSGVSL